MNTKAKQTEDYFPGHITILLAILLITACSLTAAPSFNTEKPDTTSATNDTVSLKKREPRPHSPGRASLYSALLPGSGQVYNKKYWKVPVIYAGFGTLYYFIHSNAKEYRLFREAYEHASGGTGSPVNAYEEKYDLDALKRGKDYYRRNRDLSYLVTALWYSLNIVDAAVDGYLFTWEVSDDLTFDLQPAPLVHPESMKVYTGMKITVNF